LTSREAIVLSALPVGFFGILFGLRFGLSSEVVGTTLIASHAPERFLPWRLRSIFTGWHD